MSRHRKIIMNILFGVMMVMASYPFLALLGPVIEEKIAPVVVDTRLINLTTSPNGTTMLYGTSVKKRDCIFDHIEWFQVEGSRAVRTDVAFGHGPSIVRKPGVFSFGPWTIRMQPNLISSSYAIVYHRCHMFWLSQSRFYP